VTTVHGNNRLKNTTRNALAILELVLDVPWRSAAPPFTATAVSTAATCANRHAVDFMIEVADRNRADLVLATSQTLSRRQ
jgi:inosine-uridine nucleoside N-ribohydrolase